MLAFNHCAIDRTVVWISGGSSGLGLATAKAFRKAGYAVVSGARSFKECADTDVGYTLPLDVTDDNSVSAFAQRALSLYGAPHILVLCAGILVLGPFEEYTMDEVKRVMDTNYFGQVRMVQAALPHMRKQGFGRIVLFSSINGLLGIGFQGAYTASKHAIEGFGEALSMETRPFGIEVMCVEPGDHRSGSRKYRAKGGALRETSPYYRAFSRVTGIIAHDEEHGSDPDRLGQRLVKMMQKKRLPLRVCIASADQRLAVWLHRLLPGRLFERILAMYYKAWKTDSGNKKR